VKASNGWVMIRILEKGKMICKMPNLSYVQIKAVGLLDLPDELTRSLHRMSTGTKGGGLQWMGYDKDSGKGKNDKQNA